MSMSSSRLYRLRSIDTALAETPETRADEVKANGNNTAAWTLIPQLLSSL